MTSAAQSRRLLAVVIVVWMTVGTFVLSVTWPFQRAALAIGLAVCLSPVAALSVYAALRPKRHLVRCCLVTAAASAVALVMSDLYMASPGCQHDALCALNLAITPTVSIIVFAIAFNF